MRIIQNSQGHSIAIAQSAIVGISQYPTEPNKTTITIPEIKEDVTFVNYSGSDWVVAPDLDSGLKLDNSTDVITIRPQESISLKFDEYAKNFLITGYSMTPQVVDMSGYATTQYVTTELAKKQNVFEAGSNLSFGLTTQGLLVLNCTAQNNGGSGNFDPNSSTIGTITPTNTPIVSGMSVNQALAAAQGQIAMLPLTDSVNYDPDQASYPIANGGKNERNHNVKSNKTAIQFVLSGFNDANKAKISIDNTATTTNLSFSGIDTNYLYIVLEGLRQPQGTLGVELQGSASSNYRIDIERFSETKYYVFVVKMRD